MLRRLPEIMVLTKVRQLLLQQVLIQDQSDVKVRKSLQVRVFLTVLPVMLTSLKASMFMLSGAEILQLKRLCISQNLQEMLPLFIEEMSLELLNPFRRRLSK